MIVLALVKRNSLSTDTHNRILEKVADPVVKPTDGVVMQK